MKVQKKEGGGWVGGDSTFEGLGRMQTSNA